MKKFIIITIILLLLFPVLLYADNFPSKADMYWLTQNIYHEARGETIYGQIMVGIVTLERRNIGKWGNSIKSVVTSPAQFSWYSDGNSNVPTNEKEWKTSKIVAKISLLIYNNINDVKITHYHEKHHHPYWADDMDKVITIGNHIFYKQK